ncbi:hypothetical protein H4582DRAFT_1212524 [Lactarius indigo]|nr:hypothetical protein H4582DRAFT_1212524 [Lactarius indigo]
MDIEMPRRPGRRGDPERGEQLPLGGESRSGIPGRRLEPDPRPGGGTMNNSSDGPAQSERNDFDDGANALWSLYSKEAQAHDEALLQGLLADMSGIPTFAGLFAGVITSFLVDSLKNLQPDPAQQSVYYQKQSVAMLAQISQQIASIAPQVSVPSSPPPPYPDFHPSQRDISVNTFWLGGLILSLAAALFATLVQHWVRTYLRVFERYDHPLKRARFRQFFFDGAPVLQFLATYVTYMIRISLLLFYLGLSLSTFSDNTHTGTITTAYIIPLVSIYPITIFILLLALKTPDKSLLRGISFLLQNLYFSSAKWVAAVDLEARQERVVMEGTEHRKRRDVRAIRWLVNRAAANADVEPLVLAIPGSFNTDWGKDVWKDLSSRTHGTSESPTGHLLNGRRISLIPHSTPPLEGASVDTITRCVRYLFETCNHHSNFENEEARHRRMRACVEAAASLVCRVDYQLDWFGEVGKVVSEIGQIEKINSPTTTSGTSFVVRWTCLSLVDIQQKLGKNRLRVLAGYAVNGLDR